MRPVIAAGRGPATGNASPPAVGAIGRPGAAGQSARPSGVAAISAPTAAFGPALDAEHAAVFGYGVVGAHLDSAELSLARQAELAHRSRRDELMARIMNASATPSAAAPAYNLPFVVADRASALRLAIAIEEGAARAWRTVLPATSGDDRRLGLEGLMDCAVWATRWRRAAGVIPPTVAFPGAPPTD